MNTKKIFINAPVMNVEQNNLPVFQEMQKLVWAHDMEAYAPALLLKTIDPKEPKQYLKDCTSILVKCDVMITHGDWFEFQECLHLNEIARIIGIEVIHHSAFNKWAETQKK